MDRSALTSEKGIEASLLPHLAEVAKTLPVPFRKRVEDPIFLEGKITVYHVDGWVVGTFEIEEDWWKFSIGDEE